MQYLRGHGQHQRRGISARLLKKSFEVTPDVAQDWDAENASDQRVLDQ